MVQAGDRLIADGVSCEITSTDAAGGIHFTNHHGHESSTHAQHVVETATPGVWALRGRELPHNGVTGVIITQPEA